MKSVKFIALWLCMALFAGVCGVTVGAIGDLPDNKDYIYSYDSKAVYAPPAYSLKKTVYPYDIGVEIGELQDICIAESGEIYLLDKGKNAVLRLSKDYKLEATISSYSFSGKQCSFNAPEGISVSPDGSLCICDTAGGRIVLMSKNGETLQVIEKPTENTSLIDYEYFPIKAAKDTSGRILAIVRDQTQGLMVFGKNGKFTGYLGATPAKVDALELIWRSFMTKEQKKRSIKFIPTEFNNMDIDEDGFIYATSLSSTKLSRLNPGGKNVLKTIENYAPFGDIDKGISSISKDNDSTIVDVAAGSDGSYSILAQDSGRVFTYDRYGNLLYVFGNLGTAEDMIVSPGALCYNGNDIIVTDKSRGCLKIFTPNEYALLITKALSCHESGRYTEEREIWNTVLGVNNNYELGYLYLGKISQLEGKYDDALKYFKLADNKESYSKVLGEKQSAAGKSMVLSVFIVASVIAVIAIALAILKRRGISFKNPIKLAAAKLSEYKAARELSYSWYTCTHPFKGFWDIKAEHRCGVLTATVLLVFSVVVNIVYTAFLPYLFAADSESGGSLLINGVISVAFLPIIWCVANWAFTTLADGKGSFKDIYVYTMIAMLPRALTQVLALVLSQFITLSGQTFFNTVLAIGLIWSLFLLFCGTLVTHQYTAPKTVFFIILAVVGILIILFIGLVVISLMQKMYGFASEIITEFSVRV